MRDKREEKSHLSLGLSAARNWCGGLGTGPCYVKRSEDVLMLPKEKEKGTARESAAILNKFPQMTAMLDDKAKSSLHDDTAAVSRALHKADTSF